MIVIPENQYEMEIAAYRGGQVHLWGFHPTFFRMLWMLSWPDNAQNNADVIYLIAVGCISIKGPLRWKNCDISIQYTLDENASSAFNRRCIIIDNRGGFSLECGGVALIKGPVAGAIEIFERS